MKGITLRKTLVSALCAFMLITGFGVITAPPAAASSACPNWTTTYDWAGPHATCLKSTLFAAENWAQGPYGDGVFYRHPAAYGYPAYCFGRTTRWLGVAGGGSTGWLHAFWMKIDNGSCTGAYVNASVASYLELSYYNIYGVEETLNGTNPTNWCGSDPGYDQTDIASSSSGNAIGSSESWGDLAPCIPKTVGDDWKPGYYRAKQRLYVTSGAPYFSFTVYSDHHVCLPGTDC